MRLSIGALNDPAKMVNGFLCMHIVLKQRDGIIIKLKGQVKTKTIHG